ADRRETCAVYTQIFPRSPSLAITKSRPEIVSWDPVIDIFRRQ
ncbi:unnamed protein product, partial [Staurois parvus]